MAQPKGYNIKEFSLLVLDEDLSPDEDLSGLKFSGEKAFDLRGMCSAFNYYESIESPIIRMEMVIFDTVDLNNILTGNEYVKLVMSTDTAPDDEIEVIQKVFKIGEVTKTERAQTYMLYTISPGGAYNESNRVFKAFSDIPGSDAITEIEKKYLKRQVKHERWEDARGNFNFIAPSWRAFDCIGYISDKIVGGSSGRPGYLYWETYRGTNFCTMDYLCSGSNPSFNRPKTFTYEQANVGNTGDVNGYKIQSINYPDRANNLERMRSGMYSSVTLGLAMPALTSGFLPAGGQSDGNKNSSPSGSINGPINMGAKTVWGMSNHLNSGFPFYGASETAFSEAKPTRIKIRALPVMKNSQNAANPDGNASNMTFDTVSASAYSTSRWQLLNAIKLDIVVPGNSGICAGDVVNVNIPASQADYERVKVDEMYSGKYLVLGVKHSYSPEGVTSYLNLAKDSIL